VSLFGPSKPAAGLPCIRRKNRPGSEGFGAWAAIKRLGVSCFVCLIRGLIAVRWSACLKIRAGRATGLQSLALQFLSFRRGRQCPRFTIVSPHSGDCGARPVTRSVSALLTRSSRRRLNGFSGVSQYRVEDGPPPLLQRSRPKVPVDYSLVDGLSLVAGFHPSSSLCPPCGTCYFAPNICSSLPWWLDRQRAAPFLKERDTTTRRKSPLHSFE
jgi:hypothetical protein